MQIPRLMIAAPQGRSGKTTVAIGLCAALRQMGMKVKPFKKGPDYIDPSWLSAASGMCCSNLDPFMFGLPTLMKGFQNSARGADIAIIEASMGLYDSSCEDGRGSSAWLARQLQAPIILVVNCARMTRSAAAMVRGYQDFERGTHIAGVILNNVGNPRHQRTIVKALEQHCGIPVLGALPRDERLGIRERHLGIVPLQEQAEAAAMIDRMGSMFKKYTDIDRILNIARGADRLPSFARNDEVNGRNDSFEIVIARSKATKQSKPRVTIGVLADKAFTFYYPENLEALEQAGARLVYIDSFKDSSLPEIDALYIGGGFPELYAAELEANAGLRQSIKAGVESGLPVYAECAGLMYLCNAIIQDGRAFSMCGAIKSNILIEKKPQGHGYVIAEVTGENPFFGKGSLLRGHEFHHSRLVSTGGLKFAYKVTRGHGVEGHYDGITYKNVLASYTHLHAWGMPDWADNFVKLASAGQRAGQKLAV
jgi:cobyrinic acid a,c-diamide synthase